MEVQAHARHGAGRTGQALGGVAAALMIALGSLLPASEASAVVVFSGPVNIVIPVTTDGIYMNVVTGVVGVTPGASAGWDLNLWGAGSLFAYTPNPGVGGIVTGLGASASAVDNLALGTVVSPASVMSLTPSTFAGETGATAFNLSSTANYIGFKFLNEATGVVDYGWMQLSIGATLNSAGRSIVGYAYENSGASIAVGNTGAVTAVPEPSTFALAALGLGAIGLARKLRKR